MDRYKITTLVDITRSQPGRNETNVKKLGQQSNFNSLLQAINLRTNVASDRPPTRNEGRLPEPFNGRSTYWIYEFETERSEVFWNNGDPVGCLKDDLDGVPIIDGLDNIAVFGVPAFRTKGDKLNTVIEIIS